MTEPEGPTMARLRTDLRRGIRKHLEDAQGDAQAAKSKLSRIQTEAKPEDGLGNAIAEVEAKASELAADIGRILTGHLNDATEGS